MPSPAIPRPPYAPALTIVLRANYTRGNVCKWWTWVRRNHPGTLSACAGSTENFTATPKRRRKELDIRAGVGEGGESGARGGRGGGEGTRRQKARSNFRVCDVLINYESFGRTFADSSTGDRLRRLRNEFVIVIEPDGERELSATCPSIMPTSSG